MQFQINIDEILRVQFDLMRNAQSEEVRRKAAKDLFEAYAGKPSQAVQLDALRNEQRTLTIRWLPPDPNDKSVVIEPEP